MLDFRLMQLDLRRSTLPFEGEKMCKAATEMVCFPMDGADSTVDGRWLTRSYSNPLSASKEQFSFGVSAKPVLSKTQAIMVNEDSETGARSVTYTLIYKFHWRWVFKP